MTPRGLAAEEHPMLGEAGAMMTMWPHTPPRASTALATPQSRGPPGPSDTTGPPESPLHTAEPRVVATIRPVAVTRMGSRCVVFSVPTPSADSPAPASRSPGGGRSP